MAAAWAEGAYREAHPGHKGRLWVRFPLRPPPGQCRDTPLGWSYQTQGNPERRMGDGERPVTHRKDGSRPAGTSCGTTIRDSGVWSPILLLPLAEEGKRQFNSGLSHQRHCRPSSKGNNGGSQRREGPCESHIISRSGLSATIRCAAPDLGAARIHARSERPENPTFDPYPVVHIGLRVAGSCGAIQETAGGITRREYGAQVCLFHRCAVPLPQRGRHGGRRMDGGGIAKSSVRYLPQ